MLKITDMARLLPVLFLLFGCGAPIGQYGKIERYFQKQQFEEADRVLEKSESEYGGRNSVLYDMDRAMTLHLAGRYGESNKHLDSAARRIDDLYTKSVTGEAGAMLTNDTALPYEGEDFEKVMVHLLSALNYALLSAWDDALVEVRQMDHLLNVLNDKYEKKNVYKEDAFAGYLSGILYENKDQINDAFIAYRNAYEIYRKYQKDYQTPMPPGIPADLLRTTEALGLTEEHSLYREKFPDTKWTPESELRQQAEMILISLDGLSPVKEDFFVDAPIPQGKKKEIYFLRVAFPRFVDRPTDLAYAEIRLTGPGGTAADQRTVLVEDISAIGRKNLEDRIGRITAKAIARATTKYLASRTLGHEASKAGGAIMGDVVGLLSNVYAVASEQADKRSWRTLPGQIRMARITVPPGTYTLTLEYYSRDQVVIHRKEMEVSLKAGEKRFLTSRVPGSPLSRPRRRG